jgi:type VI protein secretion system component VasK
MTFALLLPILLCFLVLGAHFLHADNLPLVGLSLALPFLLLIRRRWVVWLIQVALLLAAFEWLWTMIRLIGEYEEGGRPWKRMVIILGSVMVFTMGCGMLFATPKLRKRYDGPESERGFEPIMPPAEQQQIR